MKYTFSFYAPKKVQRIAKPSKWYFWKRPVVTMVDQQHRFYMQLTEDEGDMLIKESHDRYADAILFPALVRALTGDSVCRNVQIEEGHMPSAYVPTLSEYVKTASSEEQK